MATKKCTKCGMELPLESFDGSKSICKKCQSKNKIRNIVLVGLAGLGLGIGTYAYMSRPMEAFEGVDDVKVEETEFKFDISQAVAMNSPISVNGTVDNIESFKTLFSQSVESSKQGNTQSIVIPSIGMLFGKNSSELTNSELIKEFVLAYMQTNKTANVLVEGYTCDLGSNEHNMILSQKRAETVKNYMVSLGMSSDKIIIKSYGEEQYNKLGLKTKEEHRRVNVSIE